MKVVLFCGGYGMRMRDGVTMAPKPMAMIGDRPLIWHVMRYYAHYGHDDFILCLGYGAEYVKDYFLSYQESLSNDFVFSEGGKKIELLSSDISSWRITFVNTGLDTAIGERLRRVRHHLDGEEMFLANYADVLTDAPLDEMIARLAASDAVASLLAVPPQSAFHCLQIGAEQRVERVQPVHELPLWENGGYFVLRPGIFDVLHEGADLVEDGCGALARRGALLAHSHKGFWQPADTLKERAKLEEMYHAGVRPWAKWEHDRGPLDAMSWASASDHDAR